MWGAIIAAVSGAVIGGAVQGITAYETTEQKVGAYKKASEDVRNATDKYSGKNALDTMTTSGRDYSTEMGNAVGGQMVADNIAPTSPGVTGAGANALAYNNSQNVGNKVQSAAQSGFNQGVSNAQAMNDALYNKETVGAQQAMNQADINYNVANQAVQEGMNTVGNIAQTYNTIKSDERLKNDEQASVEDALRQIESINYKYKPETGLDQDEHVGVTAQSVEDTALDNGMVSEDENGYKQLDKQKLMESIFAAQAALQKQIDTLKKDDGKFTSDENCKDIENAIESNPQEAAQALPQGSAIQKEAVQAIDGGKDAEVNNNTVDRWYENLDLKTKRTLNKDAKPVLDKLMSLKMNEPGYEDAVNEYRNYAKENGFFPGLNYSNPNRGKLAIGDIISVLGENFYNPPTYDPYEFTDWALDRMNPKQPEPEPIDPTTAAMNAGLSEDDDDYFTSDERCKDIEKKIESGEELPENAPEELKKEAEQLTDDDKRNDEVNNETVEKAAKKIGSFMIDIPTKEISQQEYNDMSIEDLEKADAEAMKGQGDYITVANDLGLDENDLYYFEDPSFVNELTEEQKEEIKNEPDKEKKIGLLNKIKEAIGSFSSTGESELDINTGDVANSESASTPLTSGVSLISPSFASGSSGASIDVSNNVGNIENEVEAKDSKAHSTSANEIDVAEKESNYGSMNSANQNEHLDDTLDNLSFEETKHNEEVKSNEQFELGGTEGHTSDSNEGVQLPELNSAEDVKKAIIDDSKNWNSENSGSRFLPFKFTVVGDEVIVSQIGTARKEDFDLFAKDEPGSVNQIKAILSNK